MNTNYSLFNISVLISHYGPVLQLTRKKLDRDVKMTNTANSKKKKNDNNNYSDYICHNNSNKSKIITTPEITHDSC